MLKSPLIRLSIAAAVVIVIFAGSWYSSYRGGTHRPIRLPDQPVSTILDGIYAGLMDFGRHAKIQDDVSLLGIEVKR